MKEKQSKPIHIIVKFQKKWKSVDDTKSFQREKGTRSDWHQISHQQQGGLKHNGALSSKF